jgi:hypothetical protein
MTATEYVILVLQYHLLNILIGATLDLEHPHVVFLLDSS